MAGTRTFTNSSNGPYGSHYPQSLIVSWDDYDVANNRTYIRITYQRSTDNQSVYYNHGYANPSQISIDGNQVASATPYSAHNTQVTQTLCTYEGWIYHNSEGKRNITVSASFSSTATNLPSGSVSGNLDLPTIPRASDIGVMNANIGSNTTITINKKNNSFSSKLYWRVQGDSNWIHIGDTSQTSYAWLVPTSLYQRTINSKTIICEFKAITMSGSSQIGEKTTTATFTATGDPIINSVDIIDVNSSIVQNLTGDNSKLVMYHSNAKISVDVSAQNSATMSSVKVNGSNATYNSTSGKWEIQINNVNTNEFIVDVKDSRGYPSPSDPRTYTVTKVDYIPLTINASLSRNEPTDGKVNISINGNYFNGNFGLVNNNLTVQYRYIEYGGTYDPDDQDWQSLTPTISNNKYSLNSRISGIDYTKQYEFQVRVIDRLENKSIIGISIPKGKPVYNWGEDFFNVNGELRINEVALNLYPVGSIYMSVNNINPSTYFGGTWVAWGSGRVPVGVNTSETEFNTVEKTGGSKELQQHTHSARLNNNGNHRHKMHFGGNAGSGSGDTIPVASVYWGDDYGSMTEGEHDHGGITVDNAGSGNSGNLQPYITCYMWKRTA